MRLRFDASTGDDDHAAATARRRLVEDFATWLDGHPVQGADAGDVELLLDWKYHYADGDFGAWSRVDVDELLLEHLPRKFTASTELAASIPTSLGAFVTYLDDVGLLGEGDPADAVATRARAQQQAFLDAMEDPRNWGMAKRLMSTAGFDAGNVPDQDALDAAMASFNARSFEERGRILGLDEYDEPIDDDEPIALPFLALPSADELSTAAADVALLRDVDALHAELGDHGLDVSAARTRWAAAIDVAVGAGAVDLDGAIGRPASNWTALDGAARWEIVMSAAFDRGAATLASPTGGDAAWTEVADDIALHLVAMLWMVGGVAPVDLLADVTQGMAMRVDPDGAPESRAAQRRLAGERVAEVLATLNSIGVARCNGDDVELLTAGARVIAPLLQDAGADVLFPEDVVELSAADLLDLIDERDDDVEALAACWAPSTESRRSRAEELVGELVACDEPDRLLLGVGLLERLGEDAVEPLRGALDTPLAPQAWLLLASAGDVPFDEVPVDMMIEASVAAFVGLARAGSPADVVESMLGNLPAAEHAGFIDRLATSTHPRTAELLDLLGRHHPDRAAAKHARKCAHRWRSRNAVRRA